MMTWKIKPDFVSFITPSKGRPSLEKTIQSLLDLDDWNWRCYIIFDGISPPKLNYNYIDDNHFVVIESDKIGHAGLLRNLALPLIDTRWTAFIDDDDFLSSTYVSKLKLYERIDKEKDIFIFSYLDVENQNLQPPRHLNKIIRCNVGISFAIKTEFVKNNNIQFVAGGIEDFEFLDQCEKKGAKYLITHDVQYFVGHRSSWK